MSEDGAKRFKDACAEAVRQQVFEVRDRASDRVIEAEVRRAMGDASPHIDVKVEPAKVGAKVDHSKVVVKLISRDEVGDAWLRDYLESKGEVVIE